MARKLQKELNSDESQQLQKTLQLSQQMEDQRRSQLGILDDDDKVNFNCKV